MSLTLALTWLLLAADAREPGGGALESALALEQQGRDQDALVALDAIVKQSPGEMMPRLEDARLRLKLGKGLDLAEAHLEAVRSRVPENPRAHYLWALLCDEKGRHQEARRALEVALALRPDYADARYRLAGLLFADSDFPGAAAAYTAYVTAHPEATGARLQLASALERAGKPHDAESELRRLSKAGNPLAAQRLAELLEREGKKTEAASVRRTVDPPRKVMRELKPSGR